MKCNYCNGTGKHKQPKDQERFDYLVDIEMDKGDFVSYEMAKERVLKKVAYDIVDCPDCNGTGEQ